MRSTERGRSMVEMLGVLAIIGVLSVAGIVGYSYAMAKHKANEVAQQTSIAFVRMMSGENPQNTTVTGIEMKGVKVNGLNSDNRPIAWQVDFGDNKSVCEQFVQMYRGNPNFEVIGSCE